MKSKTFSIAKDLQLPTEAVTQAFGILGRRGSGKTNTAVVMAEEMLAANHQVVVLDPLGVWFGLRSSPDGKSAGYSIAILGGEHGDVPLEPSAGKVVADFIVTQRLPAILDVSAFGENDMKRFVADFARQFYHVNRDPVHVFIDEADEFCPQQATGGGPIAACLGAIQNIVRRGRARGIGVTLITQRSAVLNKSVLTQTECLIAMQTTGPHDQKAIEAWIQYHGTAAERDTIMRTLPTLAQGEGWVYSPSWLKILRRVKFRARRTFDSSRTPKPGETRREPKRLAEVDLKSLTKEMQATIERAAADDPKKLRAKIAELERAKTAAVSHAKNIETIKKVEVPVITKKETAALDKMAEQLNTLGRQLERFSQRHGQMYADIDLRLGKLDEKSRESKISPSILSAKQAASKRAGLIPDRQPKTRPPADNGTLPAGEAAILRALIQYPNGLARNQLTTLTAYKRSTRDAYIQRLREKCYCEVQGDRVRVTEEGEAAMPDAEPLPTGVALQQFWMARLPAGEAAILQKLIEAYPNAVDRESLTESTGYQRSTRDAYIQRLSAKELCDGSRGAVKAADTLMEG